MKPNRLIVFSFLLIFINACAEENTVDIKSDPISTSNHFSFVLYDGLSGDITRPILKKLEDNYARILEDLKVEKMDPVKVEIWNDETQFQNVMKRDLGTNFLGATGYVYGKNNVRILNRGNAAMIALHEFSHTVSLYVNNKIGNNPRWLWEAIALYETGDFVNPKSVSYLVAGNFPTLNELNTDYNQGNQKIYQVGYLISEYIIYSWGRDKYVQLIKKNGDIQSALEISVEEFEAVWKNFVINKYLQA
jgi:hypothetical protein